MLCASPSRAARLEEDAAEPQAAGSQAGPAAGQPSLRDAGKEVTCDWHPGLSRTLRAAEQPAFVRNFLFRSGNASARSSAGIPGAVGTAMKILACSRGGSSPLDRSTVRTPGAVPTLPEGTGQVQNDSVVDVFGDAAADTPAPSGNTATPRALPPPSVQ